MARRKPAANRTEFRRFDRFGDEPRRGADTIGAAAHRHCRFHGQNTPIAGNRDVNSGDEAIDDLLQALQLLQAQLRHRSATNR